MSSNLKKLPEFLKPYFIELIDTLLYMLKDIFSLISIYITQATNDL
jgi:hypothetical protein